MLLSLLASVRPHTALTTRVAPLMSAAPTVSVKRCDMLITELFGDGKVDPAAVAAACSESVEWVDMGLKEPLLGAAAVEAHLAELYPSGSKLVVERVSDGAHSGGFSWHREAEGVEGSGLRGITYVELGDDGRITYVQDGYEPLFKLGTTLETIFKLAAKVAPKVEKAPGTFARAQPKTAEGIVRYLWEVAYPGGAEPSEALTFFDDNILYEDFNYPEAFVGLGAVREYINLLPDIPNVLFVLERCSEGSRRCCYTWKVMVNGEEGPSGISLKEVNDDGLICFNRDIPAPAWPRTVGRLAAKLRPRLGVFRSRRS